jgi:hypothetical protein
MGFHPVPPKIVNVPSPIKNPNLTKQRKKSQLDFIQNLQITESSKHTGYRKK